jgi:tetratricopeptide (TPR) repeat protein
VAAILSEASRCLDRGDTAAGRATLERATALAPESSEAWLRLGIVLETDRDLDGALRAYERGVAAEPRHARLWERVAELRRARGDAAGTLVAVTRRIELGGASQRFRVTRADLRWADDREGARDDLLEAVELESTDLSAWTLIGERLSELGEHAGAFTAFERAYALAPDDSRLGMRRARERVALRHPRAMDDLLGLVRAAEEPVRAEALRFFDEVRPRPGRDPKWIVDYVDALLVASQGNLPSALSKLGEVLADPELLPEGRFAALVRRADVLLVLGDTAGCEADLDAAAAVSPADPEPWKLRARLRTAGHDHAGSAAAFAEAVRRAPWDPVLRINVAESYVRAGDVARGVAELERVRDGLPVEHPDARAARKALKELGR